MKDAAKQRHELELSLFRDQQQLPAAQSASAQAIFDLRKLQEELMGYEHGFAGLIARFTGRREDKLEQLRSAVRHGEAQRDARRRELEALEQAIRKTEDALAVLPGWAELDSPEWEVRTLIPMLGPMLERNHEALKEARKSLRGERTGEIMSAEKFQSFYGEADRTGEACAVLLKRLNALGCLPQVPPYYRDPPAYTANAATAYSRLDRVNEAIGQCAQMLSALPELERSIPQG